MSQFVDMEHKETGGTARATEAALKYVWAPLGWTKVTKSTKKQPEQPTTKQPTKKKPTEVKE